MNNDSHNKNTDLGLEQLWQEQKTLRVDVSDITARAKKQQLKQRIYMALDVLGLLPIFVLLSADIRLTPFLKWFVAINLLVLTLMIAHLIKLRWVAAFSHAETTERFIETLLRQLKNNAKIAWLNKHSAWIALLIATLGLAINKYFYPKQNHTDWLELVTIFIATIAFVLVWTIWAHKRQKRFENEAKELEQFIE